MSGAVGGDWLPDPSRLSQLDELIKSNPTRPYSPQYEGDPGEMVEWKGADGTRPMSNFEYNRQLNRTYSEATNLRKYGNFTLDEQIEADNRWLNEAVSNQPAEHTIEEINEYQRLLGTIPSSGATLGAVEVGVGTVAGVVVAVGSLVSAISGAPTQEQDHSSDTPSSHDSSTSPEVPGHSPEQPSSPPASTPPPSLPGSGGPVVPTLPVSGGTGAAFSDMIDFQPVVFYRYGRRKRNRGVFISVPFNLFGVQVY